MISAPEITENIREEGDRMILMGCDGVWERYVSNNNKMMKIVSELTDKYEAMVAMEKLFTTLSAKD